MGCLKTVKLTRIYAKIVLIMYLVDFFFMSLSKTGSPASGFIKQEELDRALHFPCFKSTFVLAGIFGKRL